MGLALAKHRNSASNMLFYLIDARWSCGHLEFQQLDGNQFSPHPITVQAALRQIPRKSIAFCVSGSELA